MDKRINLRSGMILLIGFVFLLSLSFVCSLDFPTYNQFYGFVNYSDGSLVLVNINVSAYFNGSLVKSNVLQNGRYGYNDPYFIIEGLSDNDTISFYVNGSFYRNVSFKNEETTSVDFVINSSNVIPPPVCPSGTSRCSDGVCSTNCGGGGGGGGGSGTRTTTTTTTTTRTNGTTTPAFSFEQSIKKPLVAFLSDQYENNRTGLVILIVLFSVAILLVAVVLILFVVKKLRSKNAGGINLVAEKEKRVAEWKQLEKERAEEQKKVVSRMPIVREEIKPVIKPVEVIKPIIKAIEVKPVVKSIEVARASQGKSFFAKIGEVLNPTPSKPGVAKPVEYKSSVSPLFKPVVETKPVQIVKPVEVTKPMEVKPVVKPVEIVRPVPAKSVEFSRLSDKSKIFINRLDSFVAPRPLSEGHGLERPVIPIKPVVDNARSANMSANKAPVNVLGGGGLFIDEDNKLREEIYKCLSDGQAALSSGDFERTRATYSIIKGLYNSLNVRDYKTYYAILDFYNEIIKLEY